MRKRLKLSIREKLKYTFDVATNARIRANILEAIPFWIAASITGTVAVVYTFLFDKTDQFLHRLLEWHKSGIFILAPLAFLISWLLVKIIEPNAGGSGIPQVMAAIEISSGKNSHKVSKLLSLRIASTKIISSMFMVLGGGAIGREGPTIQIAGSIFKSVSNRIPESWPKLSQRSFLLTGAAAGLAAAFNTPLGGIVFAIEELAKVHISLFRTALFTSVIIAGLTAQAMLGPYLFLGYPDVKSTGSLIFFGVFVVAIIAGIGGALMCSSILMLLNWKRKLSIAKSIAFILCVGLIVATVAYFFDIYILGSGKDLLNQTLFTKEKYLGIVTCFARVLGPVLSFSVGGAGGIFAPSLSAGASIGSLLSEILHFTGANANLLILSGMVGFLTGVTRTPFTSAILVLEMTDRHSVIFYLMLASGLDTRCVPGAYGRKRQSHPYPKAHHQSLIVLQQGFPIGKPCFFY
ncbi:chloride channel protein [Polluticoccus soli]|uniref:chloride channel protein n=1 Tax=Polluticoccus soli TaxID=3034150 RepID=UPI0023E30160|nr:chloride channel protein [Flavipsychrobacter sp. JY13-12]